MEQKQNGRDKDCLLFLSQAAQPSFRFAPVLIYKGEKGCNFVFRRLFFVFCSKSAFDAKYLNEKVT